MTWVFIATRVLAVLEYEVKTPSVINLNTWLLQHPPSSGHIEEAASVTHVSVMKAAFIWQSGGSNQRLYVLQITRWAQRYITEIPTVIHAALWPLGNELTVQHSCVEHRLFA